MGYLERLAAEMAAGRPVAVVKVVAAPEGSGLRMGDAMVVGPGGALGGAVADEAVVSLARQMLAAGRSGTQRVGDLRVYVESFLPDPVLVVIGAGHVGQMTAQFGAMAGFAVAVLDDRPAYASPGRFPDGVTVLCRPFLEGLGELGLGPRHHVVLMTRGHHQDLLCLRQLVTAPVPYLGMIGSRTRVETVLAILRSEGLAPDLLERVRAPIGLDLGARTPAEIAISVVAEVIAARRGGSGAPLSALRRALVHTNRR